MSLTVCLSTSNPSPTLIPSPASTRGCGSTPTTSTMGPRVGEPGLEPGAITVVVSTPSRRLTLLRDALYAITALACTAARAIVLIDARDPEHVEATTRLIARFDGLLDVRLMLLAEELPTSAAAFNRALAQVSTEFCT